MTTNHRRIQVGVGARVRYDGKIYTITELLPTITGTDVVLAASLSIVRVSLVTLLEGVRAQLVPIDESPDPADTDDSVGTVLGSLNKSQEREIRRRADHIRELLTGYRSGTADLNEAFTDKTILRKGTMP